MNKKLLTSTVALAAICVAASAAAQSGGAADDQLSIGALQAMKAATLRSDKAAAGSGVLGRRSNGGVLGVDSIANWSSYFYDPGLDGNGFVQFSWPYTMVGSAPFGQGEGQGGDGAAGGTTSINAPIVPVNLDLRNFDGSPRFVGGHPLISLVAPYITPVLKSPIFDKTLYDSSHRPTQFTDAVQRATFFNVADDGWHTLLLPSVKATRTLVLIRGTYRFALNPDGTCCAFVLIDEGAFLNGLFPPTATDTSTVMGAAENAHDIQTSDLSTFLFPNAFLYQFGNPADCCILGFHSYDLEPGSASNGWRERRYVMNYSSWISPGLFGAAFTDVTALSHELAETFNDPFVNNVTPWWLAPNGLCQDTLETGDVIEGLPNATFPVTLNGFTYHPQNEALLPWFASVTPSPAINGAYSYPDTTVLTSASTSMLPDCSASFTLARTPPIQ